MDKTLPEIVREIFDNAEKWLGEIAGLPRSFLWDMGKDSDWLMLIKCHALLETCVNHILTEHFKEPSTAKVFSRLEMSNSKTGEMAFVAACNLLPKGMRTFIQKLSEMRNFAVHDIRNFNFTFDAYRQSLKLEDRKAWGRAIAFTENTNEAKDSAAQSDLKTAVQMGCVRIIMQSYGRAVEAEYDRRVKQGHLQPRESTPKAAPQTHQSKARPPSPQQ